MLTRELTEEKLLRHMCEWCETKKRAVASRCYEDLCVTYDDLASRKDAAAELLLARGALLEVHRATLHCGKASNVLQPNFGEARGQRRPTFLLVYRAAVPDNLCVPRIGKRCAGTILRFNEDETRKQVEQRNGRVILTISAAREVQV